MLIFKFKILIVATAVFQKKMDLPVRKKIDKIVIYKKNFAKKVI